MKPFPHPNTTAVACLLLLVATHVPCAVAPAKTLPANCSKILLWETNDPKRALDAAETCGASDPAVAYHWHLPSHLYFKLHRYAQALWHQEASARVDHANFERQHLSPLQSATYLANQNWLAETLLRVGRGKDAALIARNLIALNDAAAGWNRLLDALNLSEDWTGVHRLQGKSPPQGLLLKWQRLQGVAAYHLGNTKELIQTIASLPAGKDSKSVRLELAALLDLRKEKKNHALKKLKRLAAVVPGPTPYDEIRPGLVKDQMASYFAAAGDLALAHFWAQAAVKENPEEVLPLAHFVEFSPSGKERLAAWHKLGRLARFADMDLPVFQRLQKGLGVFPRVIAGLDWKEPRLHPALEKMGALFWAPRPTDSVRR